MRTFFLWLFFYGYFFTSFLSAGVLEIGDRDSYWVQPYCEYTAVEHMSDTPKELFNSNSIWVKDKKNLKLNDHNRAFWMRLKVKNQDNIEKSLFLISKRNYVYSIEYYLLNKNKVLISKVSSKERLSRKNRENSDYNGLHITFPLILKSGEEMEILFKAQSFNSGAISFNIITREHMTKFYQDYSFFKGIYFGIMLIMILYNIVLYLFFRFTSYIYYVLYVASYFLYSLGYSGYYHHYTNLSGMIIDVIMVMGYTGFLVFVGSFIKELFFLKKENPFPNRWIVYIQVYLLLLLLLKMIAIYQDSYVYIEYLSNLQHMIIPFYYLIILYALYTLARKNNKLAFWYLLSWGIIGAIGLLQIAAFSGIVSMEHGFDHIFEASMAFETLLFSILLSLRIKEMKREKEEKDKMLIQQNKLASMGEMIVSIAHQWRQPLAEINGVVMNLDLDYQNKKLDNDKLQVYLADIESTTQHLSETMNDFMDFFNHKKELNDFYVRELFEHAIKLVQMSSRTKVKMVYDRDSRIAMAGYKSELVQVLLIIINNSLDAFETSKTQNPKIEMSAIKIDNYIHFTIEDNGGGIPLTILDKIYEPYFTSKPKTKGTGLGLYILKIIIEKSMLGEVFLENSQEGVRCKFKILDFGVREEMLV